MDIKVHNIQLNENYTNSETVSNINTFFNVPFSLMCKKKNYNIYNQVFFEMFVSEATEYIVSNRNKIINQNKHLLKTLSSMLPLENESRHTIARLSSKRETRCG